MANPFSLGCILSIVLKSIQRKLFDIVLKKQSDFTQIEKRKKKSKNN